jgi:hypothetical protein
MEWVSLHFHTVSEGKVQNMDPRSMDPLSGLGPWTPSMDRVHGPLHGSGPWTPSMGRIFPNFNITVKYDSSFQFLKIF